MLGELTGEDEAHGGLDLAGGDRRLLVVARELGRLGGDLREEVGGFLKRVRKGERVSFFFFFLSIFFFNEIKKTCFHIFTGLKVILE